MEKLYEEQHQWDDAYATRQKLARNATPETQARHQAILAFLENEIGLQALKEGRLDRPSDAPGAKPAVSTLDYQ